MTKPAVVSAPVPARLHRSSPRGRGGTATTLVIVYVVLLFAVPSHLRFTSLGSLGKPALLWGIFLMIWWSIGAIRRRDVDVAGVRQPVRLAFVLLVLVALVSFSAAMLRAQPADQVSPAVTSLLRLVSWGGVLFVMLDGIRTMREATRLVRWLVGAGAAMAGLGLLQFVVGSSLTEWMGGIPGFSFEIGGIDIRGAFTRAAGTASHPLEFTATIAGLLPLAIIAGISGGFRSDASRRARWWLPAILLVAASVLSVSRSAVIGMSVAILAVLPALAKPYRWAVGGGLAAMAVAVAIAVPGLFATTLALFTGASDDPSALSRTDALARVPEFIQPSPLVGAGFGTFLSRYYIFDNQWVLILVELGVLGLLAFGLLIASAVASAWRAAKASTYETTSSLGYALVASTITMSVLFLFFDGLSFSISAGVLIVVIGLCGVVRTIATADREFFASGRRIAEATARSRSPRVRSTPSDSASRGSTAPDHPREIR